MAIDLIHNCRIPGRLKQFIKDLHSGKLHRIYHYGFDPKEAEQVETNEVGSVRSLNTSFL